MSPQKRPILNYRPSQPFNPKGRLILSIFFMLVGLGVLSIAFLLIYFGAGILIGPSPIRVSIILLSSLLFLIGITAIVFTFKGLAHCCVVAGKALDDLNIAPPNRPPPENKAAKTNNLENSR
jgi:hypothetical protein